MPDDTVDMVNHPPHYRNHPSGLECIQLSRHMTSDLGQAVQYVWRAPYKNGIEDLHKALWYLSDAVTHNDRMFISLTDRLEAVPMLDRVAMTESGSRREFYTAVSDLDLGWALRAVEQLVDESEAAL